MKDIAVFLFDYTGVAAEPWLLAGYECWIVDIQHRPAYETGGITDFGDLKKVHADLSRSWLPPFDRNRIAFVAAWPPCDHLAVSGARWFKGKGLRKLSDSISMFATATEFCEWSGAPYMIENPVSNIASHWRTPDCSFHPWQFTGYRIGDNYTKKTCLWVGGGYEFPAENVHEKVKEAIGLVVRVCGRMVPKPKALAALNGSELVEEWYPDDRIHKCGPGDDRKNIRSATPRGFAEAVFIANGQAIRRAA